MIKIYTLFFNFALLGLFGFTPFNAFCAEAEKKETTDDTAELIKQIDRATENNLIHAKEYGFGETRRFSSRKNRFMFKNIMIKLVGHGSCLQKVRQDIKDYHE